MTETTTSKRMGKFALLVIVLAMTVLAISNWEPVWMLVMLKRIPIERAVSSLIHVEQSQFTQPVRGWWTVKRWHRPSEGAAHGRGITFYVENGMKAEEVEWKHGHLDHFTRWNPDGTISHQVRFYDDQGRRIELTRRDSPPWWWGVIDQTGPTAPWLKQN